MNTIKIFVNSSYLKDFLEILNNLKNNNSMNKDLTKIIEKINIKNEKNSNNFEMNIEFDLYLKYINLKKSIE